MDVFRPLPGPFLPMGGAQPSGILDDDFHGRRWMSGWVSEVGTSQVYIHTQ